MMEDFGELGRPRMSGELGPEQAPSYYQPHADVEEPSFLVRESGSIRFYVRPRVEVSTPKSFAEVQRFFFTLAPLNSRLVRRVSIGKKRMPDERVRERQWAYVDRVGSASHVVADLGARTYTTKTRGVRHQAGAIEVARGAYAIAIHRDHSHLLYQLEIEPGASTQLLDDLRLVQRGSYIAAVFNPAGKARVQELDVPFGEPPLYDDELTDRFGKRRFAPLEPVFLEHEGAELVLISGGRRTPGLGGAVASGMTSCMSAVRQ